MKRLLPVTRPRPSPPLVLSIVCLAQFAVVLDGSVVFIALPEIQRDLEIGSHQLPWVINAYALVFGGILILGGRCADLFGRRKAFVVGVICFTAFSILCGLSRTGELLFIFRAAQAVGSGLMLPAGLAILTTTFTDQAQRSRALAIWAMVGAAAGCMGMLIGGVLVDALSWPCIFLINGPIGLVLLLGSSVLARGGTERGQRRLDVGGAVTVTGGLLALNYAISSAGQRGWDSVPSVAAAGAAAVLLATFVVVERAHHTPLVDLGVFRIRAVSIANVAMFLVAGSSMVVLYVVTLYLQEVTHFSALETGLAFLPSAMAVVIGAFLAEKTIPRIGLRKVLLVALPLTAAGSVPLSLAEQNGQYIIHVFPTLVLVFIGVGAARVGLTVLGTARVSEADAGLRSGLIGTSQQVGGAVWLAVLAPVAGLSATSGPDSGTTGQSVGYQLVTVGAGVLGVAATLVVMLFLRASSAADRTGDRVDPSKIS